MFTIDDLYEFYLTKNESCVFNSKDSKSVIVVQVPERIKFSDEYDPQFNLIKTHLMSCHLLENKNRSSISEEAMKQAIPSFYNRPILGYIQEIEDKDGNISYDFAGHEMYIDDDGEIEYEEAIVGVIPESCNPQLIYNEEYDKTYLEVDGFIYEDYTKAAEILREKGECSCSVEIAIDQLSFNAKTNILQIEGFHFLGVTILGVTRDESHKEIAPGMEGANIKISDFSLQNNSVFNKAELVEEITQAVMNKLDNHTAFAEENNHGKEDKPVENFENEVIETEATEEEVEVTEEKVTEETPEVVEDFDDDGASEESGGNDVPGGNTNGNTDTNGNTNGNNDATEPEEGSNEAENLHGDLNNGQNGKGRNFVKEFELSHDDIRCGLYALLTPFEESDNEWYMISEVYDDHFIYEGFFDHNNIYDQKYTKDGDEVTFEGERVHMNKVIVTDSEYAQLNEMRSNYSSIAEKLAKYEEEPEKMNVLTSSAYQSIADQKDFEEFMKMENHFDLSIDEVKDKADAMLLQYAKSGKLNFAKIETEEKHEESRKDFFAFARIEPDTSFLDKLLKK